MSRDSFLPFLPQDSFIVSWSCDMTSWSWVLGLLSWSWSCKDHDQDCYSRMQGSGQFCIIITKQWNKLTSVNESSTWSTLLSYSQPAAQCKSTAMSVDAVPPEDNTSMQLTTHLTNSMQMNNYILTHTTTTVWLQDCFALQQRRPWWNTSFPWKDEMINHLRDSSVGQLALQCQLTIHIFCVEIETTAWRFCF